MGAVHTRVARGEMFAGYSDLEVTVCTCGVLFAVPEKLLDERRYDGQSFYCPNGHCLSFNGNRKRQEEALQRAKDRAARLSAQLDQSNSSLIAQKGAATRARNERDRLGNRIKAGVCPCCNRTFKELARHMKTKHPEYDPAA